MFRDDERPGKALGVAYHAHVGGFRLDAQLPFSYTQIYKNNSPSLKGQFIRDAFPEAS